jgi:hypothetical protein
MFATLVLICGFIKVYTERQQRLKLRAMAAINESVSAVFACACESLEFAATKK